MRLADLASILAQGCTLWTDSFKLSGTPARSGGFRFYKKKAAASFATVFFMDDQIGLLNPGGIHDAQPLGCLLAETLLQFAVAGPHPACAAGYVVRIRRRKIDIALLNDGVHPSL